MEKTLKELYREQYEKLPILTQEEIEELYASEGIENISIKEQLTELKYKIERKKDELPSAENRLLNVVLGYKQNEEEEILIKREIEKLEKRYDYLESRQSYYYKFSQATRGRTFSERTFPSRELRNKIVEGTLGLAKYWASIYYKKDENTYSFDDLFQIACEALISAAHYYIPNDNAKFSTYASKCIENKLKNVVFKKKKKKRKVQNFFQKEKDFVKYVEMFLQVTSTTYEKYILSDFRKSLNEFNRNLRYLGEYKRLLPSFSYNVYKIEEKMESIVNYIIRGLKYSKLNLLITDEDRELVNLLLNFQNTLKDEMYSKELSIYLGYYIRKLELVEEYLKIEKKLQSDNDGITPTKEEILEEFNRRIKEINQEKYKLRQNGFYSEEEKDYEEPENFYFTYYNEFNVDPFISNKQYEWNGISSKAKERHDILYEYVYSDLESESEYLARVLNERRKHVNSLVNEANKEVYEYNRKIQEERDKFADGPGYKKYLNDSDISKIQQDVELLYGSDDELFELLKSGKDSRRQIKMTLEEEVLNNLFLSDYYSELELLPKLEREVLLRYFDENGQHSMTAKSIGKELEITSAKVYKLKDSGLKRLSKSKKLQAYYEE